MKTSPSLLQFSLKALGADGLCNPEEGCGCSLDDVEPCGCINLEECVAAKFIRPKAGDPDYWDEFPEGWYKVLEA